MTIDGVRGILAAGHVVRKLASLEAKGSESEAAGSSAWPQAAALVEEPLEHFDSFLVKRNFGPKRLSDASPRNTDMNQPLANSGQGRACGP
jgi:hypothetical protein